MLYEYNYSFLSMQNHTQQSKITNSSNSHCTYNAQKWPLTNEEHGGENGVNSTLLYTSGTHITLKQ